MKIFGSLDDARRYRDHAIRQTAVDHKIIAFQVQSGIEVNKKLDNDDKRFSLNELFLDEIKYSANAADYNFSTWLDINTPGGGYWEWMNYFFPCPRNSEKDNINFNTPREIVHSSGLAPSYGPALFIVAPVANRPGVR